MSSHKMNWQMKRLGELCQFQNGYSFKNRDYQDDLNDGYMVFRMGNINRGGGLNRDASPVYISKDQSTDLRRFILDKNDIVMCMTDMKSSMNLLGHTALIDKSDYYILNQRVGRITVTRKDALDYRYLFYYTNNKTYLEHLRSVAHSGVQVNLSTKAIRESPILLPPLPTQHKIAAVLSPYDDLIENNTRRIKILEEMAQAIYREWFVEFRFPGHEGVEMVDSESGLIPQGWQVVAASEAISINPKTSVSRDTCKPFVPMKSATEHSMLITELEERTGSSGRKFKNHDTLFARITPCLENGRTGFVQFLPSDDMIALGSTEFIVLRSKTLNPYFVYLLAQTHDFRNNAIKSMTGATGRQRVVDQCFDNYFLPNPDQDTLCQFESIIAPLFKQVQNLGEKNANLHETRDLLLPKLISGEIDISELNIDID